jgi:hypothetical protein
MHDKIFLIIMEQSPQRIVDRLLMIKRHTAVGIAAVAAIAASGCGTKTASLTAQSKPVELSRAAICNSIRARHLPDIKHTVQVVLQKPEANGRAFVEVVYNDFGDGSDAPLGQQDMMPFATTYSYGSHSYAKPGTYTIHSEANYITFDNQPMTIYACTQEITIP